MEDRIVMALTSVRLDPHAHLPLAAQLSEQITWLIASGALADGERLPPVRDLARELGIHMHTVRAAYGMMESKGLVATRRGRGTQVLSYDRLIQPQRTPNLPTFSIGILIPGYNMFYLPFLRGIEEAAGARHSMLSVAHTRDDPRRTKQYLDQLTAKNVDGVILVACWEPGSGKQPSHVPVVYVDIPGAPGPSVLLDSERAALLTVSHLIEHGHKRIGLITAPIETSNVRQVHQGYRQALAANGLTYWPELLATVSDFSIQSGYQAARRLLALPEPPQAVFASADQLALGAMQGIRDSGLSVPQDIAVAGYNDIEVAGFVDPPLTTATAPAYQMGIEAMQLLGRLIDGEPPAQKTILLDTQLIIRRSCGCEEAPAH